jgi:hypothetical protein
MVSKEKATRIDAVGSEPKCNTGQGHCVYAGKAAMTNIGIPSWRYGKKEELGSQDYYNYRDHKFHRSASHASEGSLKGCKVLFMRTAPP